MRFNPIPRALTNAAQNAARRTALLAVLLGGLSLAHAQPYPSKPIRLVVPVAAGGLSDILARALARELTLSLGQSVVVDNRGGGGGRIGASEAARAPADGYTLLLSNSIANGLLPAVAKSVPYDAVKSFTPVAILAWYATTIVCNPTLPFKTVPEMVAYAKRNPGKLTNGTAGPGSGNHFSGAMFNAMAGVDIVHVPYKGNAPAMQDAMAGTISCVHDGAAKPMIDAGKLRAIATTGIERDPRFPDVPTVDEAGLKGFDFTWWQGIAAPANTPPEIVDRLGQAIRKALESPEFQKQAYAAGLNLRYAAPEEYARTLAKDMDKFRKTAAAANISLD